MSPPHEEDRAAILARRALFVTSAISVLSCSSAETATNTGGTSSASGQAPSGAPTTGPSTTGSAAAPSAAFPAFADTMKGAPPRGAPTSLPPEILAEAEDLEKQLDEAYGKLSPLFTPKAELCDAADPGCKPAWRALGEAFQDARDVLRRFNGGPCGRWSGALGTLAKRRRAHQAFMEKKLDELEELYAGLALSRSAQGEQVWRGIAANTKTPPPMPCLKCMPPKRQLDDGDVRFAEGASTLDAKALEELASLASEKTSQTIEIVGHADPGEPKAGELARARAEAVAAALKKKGVAADRLRVVSLAADLPLSKDAAENRRVELAYLYER